MFVESVLVTGVSFQAKATFQPTSAGTVLLSQLLVSSGEPEQNMLMLTEPRSPTHFHSHFRQFEHFPQTLSHCHCSIPLCAHFLLAFLLWRQRSRNHNQIEFVFSSCFSFLESSTQMAGSWPRDCWYWYESHDWSKPIHWTNRQTTCWAMNYQRMRRRV